MHTVNTESSEYGTFLMPYAIICIIVYPLGVNVLYIVLLWKNRADIRVEKDCTVDAKDKQNTMVTFLHHPYSADHFWWEAVDSVCAATCMFVGIA